MRGVARTLAHAADYSTNLGIPLSTVFSNALSDTDVEATVLATPHTRHAKQMTAITRREEAYIRRETLYPGYRIGNNLGRIG